MVGKMGGDSMSHINTSSGGVEPALYYQKRPGEDAGEHLMVSGRNVELAEAPVEAGEPGLVTRARGRPVLDTSSASSSSRFCGRSQPGLLLRRFCSSPADANVSI